MTNKPASPWPLNIQHQQPDISFVTAKISMRKATGTCDGDGGVGDFQIAIHESGHTIAGYMLLTVAGSTIEFVNGHYGLTWSNAVDLEPDAKSLCGALKTSTPGIIDTEMEQAHACVIQWLAGVEAERLFCAAPLPSNINHDLAAARAAAALIVRGTTDVDHYLSFARAETRAMLSTYADGVIAIANALIKHRTLNYFQIESIVKEFYS
jgi:hypothetical protein